MDDSIWGAYSMGVTPGPGCVWLCLLGKCCCSPARFPVDETFVVTGIGPHRECNTGMRAACGPVNPVFLRARKLKEKGCKRQLYKDMKPALQINST